MASNFDFLQLHLPSLHAEAVQAESLACTAPRASCFGSRFVLEMAAQWLYANDRTLARPYEDRLGAMIHEASFKDNLSPALFAKVRSVYMLGNQAAHRSQAVGARDSARAIEDLFHFLFWLSRTYCLDATKHPKVSFNHALLRQGPATELTEERIRAIQDGYETRLTAAAKQAEEREKSLVQTEDEIARLRAELEALKAKNQHVPDDHNYNENQTRDLFIDLLLREAGWPLEKAGRHTEYPVTGMPNPTGNGFVDYVLWSDAGMPLAILEAKASRTDAMKGRHQARLYADCLQRQFNFRPVIFLSNGYDHQIWDDEGGGPPRKIAAFYTRGELEQVHWRRKNALKTSAMPIDGAIVERAYQHEAIRRTCEHFAAGHRRALVVMATGTGKTRMVIALVDLLIRANRVQRVLFLADRTNLLTQSRRAFKRHLPRVTTVDLVQDASADGTVYLSTYQTVINQIDRIEGGRRRFGPGFFDLVVTDEAHRSIYKKFGAIFEWFDGRLLGLTATPSDLVGHDTYRLFELEKGVPTAHYELPTAITEGYLVRPLGKTVPFRFLRRGIKYAELSEEEKEQYEEKFSDPEAGLPDKIAAKALNDWVFNQDTVDKALDFLMEHGLKVADGTRLGKTIIFAKNHKHAEFIAERFGKKWPLTNGHFCQVIDSHNDYAQSLLDEFSKRDSTPHIAVSVNMLDTGVDVPEVLNLVFFTATASKIRFQQMIGRGTRLCPNLLGEGRDKECFLVFDLCGNFEFFGGALGEDDGKVPASITERLLRQRAALVGLLPEGEDDLCSSLLDRLHGHVQGMDPNDFRVREKRRIIEPLADRTAWTLMPQPDREAAVLDIADIPTTEGADDDITARQFDLLALRLQIGLLQPDKTFLRSQEELRRIASNLLEKVDSLPMVAKHRGLLMMIGEDDWWADVTLRRLEDARLALRDLFKFVDKRARPKVYTDIEDELEADATDVEIPGVEGAVDVARYKRKVEAFIRAHDRHTSVWKLRHNRPLTDVDLDALDALVFAPDAAIGKDQLARAIGPDRLTVFIRRLLGLDEAQLREELNAYVASSTRTAGQVRFLDMIVAFLSKNGVMDPGLIYELPFSDAQGAFLEEDVDKVVEFVRTVNANAGWEGEAGERVG